MPVCVYTVCLCVCTVCVYRMPVCVPYVRSSTRHSHAHGQVHLCVCMCVRSSYSPPLCVLAALTPPLCVCAQLGNDTDGGPGLGWVDQSGDSEEFPLDPKLQEQINAEVMDDRMEESEDKEAVLGDDIVNPDTGGHSAGGGYL